MRRKLKSLRPKAIFGESVTAAATLAAAGIQAAATNQAAKQQSNAMINNARTQAKSIEAQTQNNNELQRQQMAFTRQQNEENRAQQRDIQLALQQIAGQQNMYDTMEANKMQVKYGGRPKHRRKLKSSHSSYRGANAPFKVTDGGGAIPRDVDLNGYGLYELFGNDHDHYHKAQGGKNKTGVGIKFNDGSVVEGEGNQNTNRGELLYVTPDDAVFISKHSIDGFNPAKAVENGAHPMDAFQMQEFLKGQKGLNDDGTSNPMAYPSSPVGGMYAGQARQGKRVSLKRCGGRVKAIGGFSINNYNPIVPFADMTPSYYSNTKNKPLYSTKNRFDNWAGNYTGAVYNGIGNFGGAGLTMLGNMLAGNQLANAYSQAGNILANAYGRMTGIDMSELKRDDYAAPHTLAVVRNPNTNITPQLERIRRNADYEQREINRNTLSSAARQQRLAATNDRMLQRIGEQYAYKQNADEQVKQENAKAIATTAQANADRDVQARKNYGDQRLQLLQYNNNIANQRLLGMAQAKSDALGQAAVSRASALQSGIGAFGSALSTVGNAFGATADAVRKDLGDFRNTLGALTDDNQIKAVMAKGDVQTAINLFNYYSGLDTPASREHANTLAGWLRTNGIFPK
nr:MAG TPA: hypothetical protein [Crassvirales sp.]